MNHNSKIKSVKKKQYLFHLNEPWDIGDGITFHNICGSNGYYRGFPKDENGNLLPPTSDQVFLDKMKEDIDNCCAKCIKISIKKGLVKLIPLTLKKT